MFTGERHTLLLLLGNSRIDCNDEACRNAPCTPPDGSPPLPPDTAYLCSYDSFGGGSGFCDLHETNCADGIDNDVRPLI